MKVKSLNSVVSSWSGLPFPSPGDRPDPGIKPGSLALQADSLQLSPLGSPLTLSEEVSLRMMATNTTSLLLAPPRLLLPGHFSRPEGFFFLGKQT